MEALRLLEVRLFATFREGREKIIMMEYQPGMTGYDIITPLGIPEEEVAIFLINGRHSKIHAELEDGSVLALFPPVGGG